MSKGLASTIFNIFNLMISDDCVARLGLAHVSRSYGMFTPSFRYQLQGFIDAQVHRERSGQVHLFVQHVFTLKSEFHSVWWLSGYTQYT